MYLGELTGSDLYGTSAADLASPAGGYPQTSPSAGQQSLLSGVPTPVGGIAPAVAWFGLVLAGVLIRILHDQGARVD